MALTPSNMLPLGSIASDFCLPDGKGELHHLKDLVGDNGLLVGFISNHCPYVIHIADSLAKLSQNIVQYQVGMVAINSNDVTAYPADSPEKMLIESQQRGYQFPYLFDETQQVAVAYQAACTPDFYLFDRELKLVYRGQFDDSRPGSEIAVNGQHLYAALEALHSGEQITVEQKPSIGCNIKWRPQN